MQTVVETVVVQLVASLCLTATDPTPAEAARPQMCIKCTFEDRHSGVRPVIPTHTCETEAGGLHVENKSNSVSKKT